MKNTYCLIVFITFANICIAQFPKGTKMLELSMNGQYDSNSDEQYSTYGNSEYSRKFYFISFYPSYDIFIKENLMLGFGPTFRSKSSDYKTNNDQLAQYEENESNTNYFGAILSLRKYYLIKDGLYWFLSFEAGYEYGIGTMSFYSSTTVSENTDSRDLKSSTILANVNGGFAYDFNKQWLLRAGFGNLGWNSTSDEMKDDDGTLVAKGSSNSLNFNAVYLTLAISLILHK